MIISPKVPLLGMALTLFLLQQPDQEDGTNDPIEPC